MTARPRLSSRIRARLTGRAPGPAQVDVRRFDPDVQETIAAVRPFTMTSPERIDAVCAAAAHVARHQVPGAVVECGVWLGGSAMAAALTLCRHGVVDRDLYLFDTFAGMPAPDDASDVITATGESAMAVWQRENARGGPPWLAAPVEQVRANMATTGYPMARVHLVEGLVEDTIPSAAPAQIALLRLDTDWYASTKLEMEQLWPRLVPGGILIVDDYGHLDGARRAVDEYLAEIGVPMFLHRIDYTGRIGVKPAG